MSDMIDTRPEKEIQKEVLRFLNAQYCTFAFKVFSLGIPDAKRAGGFRKNPMAGTADILGCKQGRFFAMEVKALDGKLSEEQRDFLTSVNIAGGYECVVRSTDDAMEAFREI